MTSVWERAVIRITLTSLLTLFSFFFVSHVFRFRFLGQNVGFYSIGLLSVTIVFHFM